MKMRNSRWTIFSGIIKGITESIIPFIGLVIFLKINLKIMLALYGIIIFVLIPVGIYLNWYFTTFVIHQGKFIFHEGVFFKSQTSLPLEKVTNVNIEQPFMQRLLHRSTLIIESASADVTKNKLQLTLKTGDALRLQHRLLPTVLEIKKEQPSFTPTKGQLFLYGITRNSLLSLIAVAFSSYFFLSEVASWFSYDFSNLLKEVLLYAFNEKLSILILGIIGLFLLSKCVTAITTYIRYNRFQVKKEEENLQIQYGYFTKNEYSLSLKKMYGIKLKQSPLFQLLGLYTIEACIIGKQADMTTQTILFPIATKETVNILVRELVPQFEFDGVVVKAEKKQLKKFILLPTLSCLISGIGLGLLHPIFFSLLLAIPLVITHGYLQFRKGELGKDDTIFYGQSGGLWNRIYYVKPNAIQRYHYSTNPFQQKQHLCTFKLYLWNDTFKLKHIKQKECS